MAFSSFQPKRYRFGKVARPRPGRRYNYFLLTFRAKTFGIFCRWNGALNEGETVRANKSVAKFAGSSQRYGGSTQRLFRETDSFDATAERKKGGKIDGWIGGDPRLPNVFIVDANFLSFIGSSLKGINDKSHRVRRLAAGVIKRDIVAAFHWPIRYERISSTRWWREGGVSFNKLRSNTKVFG